MTTSASAWRARALIAAPPCKKLSTICGVTADGYALTPSAVTPWSAAITITVFRLIVGIDCRVMPAICMATSSSRPRLPVGFVNCCCRALACSIAGISSDPIVAISSKTRSIFFSIVASLLCKEMRGYHPATSAFYLFICLCIYCGAKL